MKAIEVAKGSISSSYVWVSDFAVLYRSKEKFHCRICHKPLCFFRCLTGPSSACFIPVCGREKIIWSRQGQDEQSCCKGWKRVSVCREIEG